MKCENCGAPLTLVHGRDHLYCAFCGAFHFPTEIEGSVDKMVPLGRPTDTSCPACNMVLLLGAMEGREVSYCPRCRGVFVSHEDFAHVVRRRRARRKDPAADPVPLNHEELKRRVPCPACGQTMEVHPYYGPGSVVIDSCVRCRMVWLDYGEVAAIERAPGPR